MSDRGASIDQIANDNCMPCQWRDMHTGAASDPNALLALAVLECAIRDWQWCVHSPYERTRARRDAMRADLLTWFQSDARSAIYDFASLCDTFHLDTPSFRDRVMSGDLTINILPRRPVLVDKVAPKPAWRRSRYATRMAL